MVAISIAIVVIVITALVSITTIITAALVIITAAIIAILVTVVIAILYIGWLGQVWVVAGEGRQQSRAKVRAAKANLRRFMGPRFAWMHFATCLACCTRLFPSVRPKCTAHSG
jgi:hypothetical protein